MGTAGRARHGRSTARAQGLPDCDTHQEIRQWTQATIYNKADLAQTTYDQIYREVALIRSVAAEEQANKTTAAIDGLLLERKERLDALMKKVQEERSRLLPDRDPATSRCGDREAGGRMQGRISRGGRAVQGDTKQKNMQSGGRRRRYWR